MDVRSQFGNVYLQELIRRRNRLFMLMLASFISIVICLLLDAWVYDFLNHHDPSEFEVWAVFLIVIGRVFQQNLVNCYIYYMMYWLNRYSY